ncbi:MAG: hypothetical protein ACOY32_02125 [Thermodesulfobacteriota bacterium]
MDHEQEVELITVLEEFAALQRQHAALLAEGRLGNLQEWTEKRQRAFCRLQQRLEHFDPTMLDGEGRAAAQVQTLMREILNDEETLRIQVDTKLAELRRELSGLRRGKTVLKGYRLEQGAGPPPKYLSSKA